MTETLIPLDLTACKPEDLFRWLYQHRFSSNEGSTKTFLKAAASTSLPQVSPEKPVEEPVHSCPSVSFVSPRAKFKLSFYEKLILAESASASFRMEYGNVQEIVLFPKPEDCQKAKTLDMCLLHFRETIKFKNKQISSVCFQLPASPPNIDDDDEDGMDATDQWAQLLSRCTGKTGTVARVVHPLQLSAGNAWRYQFCSHEDARVSSTTEGMPFVKCYNGVHDGTLFPMEQGLLFYKPPLFIPRSNLESIACGRGADASSRYVDLTIQTSEGKEVQFTNIHRDELSVLNDYIHKTLIPAMLKDTGDNKALVESAEVSTEAMAVDDSVGRRGPKRKASTEASAINKRAVQQIQDDVSSDEEGYSDGDMDNDDESDNEDEELAEEDEPARVEENDDGTETESDGE